MRLWGFENMYTAEACWTQMRFHKADVMTLATELALDKGAGFIRTAKGNIFQPIEVLVTLLTRMSFPNRWEVRSYVWWWRRARSSSRFP